MLSGFLNAAEHKNMARIAFPMFLANISVPLIGLVDTAVLGHMGSATFLAGASIGALMLAQLYWVCGFLRMSTTGLSAQQFSSGSLSDKVKPLIQGLCIAVILGGCLMLGKSYVLHLALPLLKVSNEVLSSLETYFYIRVLGAPAVLAAMVLTGWLLGQQKSKIILYAQVLINVTNIGLNLLFVYVFDMEVAGVAWASVISEYLNVFLLLVAACKVVGWQLPLTNYFTGVKQLFFLNQHIFIRNLALQLCLAFVTFTGAGFGENSAAVNAIIMQFFMLVSLGLDALANAVEALVGKEKGINAQGAILRSSLIGLFWSIAVAIVYAAVFLLWQTNIVAILTNIEEVRILIQEYTLFIVLLPLCGLWCFLFDGVFVGLTRGKAMQYSMIVSAIFGFFLVWYVNQDLGNQALWIAMLTFLITRGVTLGGYFTYLGIRQVL